MTIGAIPPIFQKWQRDTMLCPKEIKAGVFLDPYPQGAPAGAKLKVTIDGTMVKMVDVKEQTLYTLTDFGANYGEHTIDVEVTSGSPEFYAVTFG